MAEVIITFIDFHLLLLFGFLGSSCFLLFITGIVVVVAFFGLGSFSRLGLSVCGLLGWSLFLRIVVALLFGRLSLGSNGLLGLGLDYRSSALLMCMKIILSNYSHRSNLGSAKWKPD